jgi:uncharacterized protein (TIGR03083 family)
MATPDYLQSIALDSAALTDLAKRHDLDLPVPACPGWTLRDLVAHVGGANHWVTTCVSSGLSAQERVLPPGPTGRDDLLSWFDGSLAELLSVLSATAPEDPVWTPIHGASGSVWWRRKQALEVAIHRTDAEATAAVTQTVIEPLLALDGIDEYAQEFLPLMLHAVTAAPPVTAVLLSPNDIEESRVLSLIPAGDDRDPGVPHVEIEASASDLLLWLWNRPPGGPVTVSGDDTVLTWWKGLAI